MEWIEFVDSGDNKVMINMQSVKQVSYDKETNLTEISTGLSTMCVKGDRIVDIKRLLTSHDHYVSRLSR